jgi:gliding motility-associated-like protein
VIDEFGCFAYDTVIINVVPAPVVELGQDTLTVYDETTLLDAGKGFQSYTWQDGSSGQYYEATENGTYWVEVSNEYCSASDTIFVILNDCEAVLIIPNCFTPNNDGFNERFNVSAQNLFDFTMYIFNRWGQMIFETNDMDQGWDGKFNGNQCPGGTYYYLIEYSTYCSFGLDKTGTKAGAVTLLK